VTHFEWDERKDRANRLKHGVGFQDATLAFLDPQRLVFEDHGHSADERRMFCLGLVDGRVLTVRFTKRDGSIRIFGAGYWRKGRRLYHEWQERRGLH